MASSGSKTVQFTEWNSLVFSWEITSQSVENNTSTVAWKVKLVSGSSGRIDSEYGKRYTITVDGNTVSGSSGINIRNNSKLTLHAGTVVIKHDSKGKASFDYSVEQEIAITFSGNYIGNVYIIGSGELDAIPRASSMYVTNGTLGTAQTISVSRNNTSYTHTITYTCGSLSGTVCTKTASESISFTPPPSLAAANTTGTTVTVTFTIKTEYGDTNIGSKTATANYSIPASIKPSCSISVSDASGWYSTYGAFVKGVSKFDVTVTATPKYGAAIRGYSISANGSTYTTASFITDLLKTSGQLSISARATDARGHTGTATVTNTVLDYAPPSISKLTVHRCNADGTENNQGEYVKATFSAAIEALNNKNTATYTLRYKKESDAEYTSVELTTLANSYICTDSSYVFEAATDSSYDVTLTVEDNHGTTTRTTSASTAFTLIHFRADGTGLAFGKLSENSNLADFGLQVRFMGGIKPPVLEPETDLNEVRTPNTYIGENVTTYNYSNCPVTSGTFTLVVESGGEAGQVKQTYITCSKYKPEKYSRFYYQGEWGEWFWASSDEVVLYENASGSNGIITLSASASHYRYLEIYFTDNNGISGGYTKVWSPNGKEICLHIQEAGSSIYSRQTIYTISGTTMTPDTTSASYVRFSGTSLSITMNGTNYIKIVRVIGRA